MRIKCSRCGKIIDNKKFSIHKCSNMRDLGDMPESFLLKIISKEITEEEAWSIIDGKTLS